MNNSCRSSGPLGVPKIHLGYLDSLRALAAMHVVMVHAMDQVDRNGLHSPGSSTGSATIALWPPCRRTVHRTFWLLPDAAGRERGRHLRGGAWHFYKKRARRILPTYYLSLAVCLLLIGTFLNQKTGSPWDLTFPVRAKDLASHLLMVQDVFDQ